MATADTPPIVIPPPPPSGYRFLRRYYSVEEAAEQCGISAEEAYRYEPKHQRPTESVADLLRRCEESTRDAEKAIAAYDAEVEREMADLENVNVGAALFGHADA